MASSFLVSTTTLPAGKLFAGVVGHGSVVERLRAVAAARCHAYLLVGPSGAGKEAAARGLAAALACRLGGCGECDDCTRALAGRHPDVVLVQRQGAALSVPQAQDIVRQAVRSPMEGHRKVLVLDELHLVEDAGPVLLKTIEEPPPTTVFIGLADFVPPELVTIASRCIVVDIGPIAEAVIEEVLITGGADAETAATAAAASGGSLDRARLLVTDPGLVARMKTWAAVPARLDGTGAAAAAIVAELIAMVDVVEAELLRERHAEEVAELDRRAKELGERGIGRDELERRHRRERRRLRTDELRLGLATIAGTYRHALAGHDARQAIDAIGVLDEAAADLTRNPNEVLLLQALLVRLSEPAP